MSLELARPRLQFVRHTFLAILAASTVSAHATAQVPDSTKKPTPADTARVKRGDRRARQHILANAAVIRWYDVAAVVGGVAALSVLDEPVQRYTQRHRSNTLKHVANAFREEGEPIYYAGVSLGILGVGIVTGNADVQRAGGRLVASVATSALVMTGLKMAIGRSRPNENVGAFKFHPFTSLSDSSGVQTRGAMPSGHTTAAFAVATSIADDLHSDAARVLLYTLATGTAFSRVYDNRHWVSDVAMGAVLG
nr:phosphatase PAP2 family protein [Gemmatimonadales bacterium]